jgi:hypothetical protein
MLGGVLAQFQEWVGLSREVLWLLAGIPVAFVGYDVVCLLTPRADNPRALGPIARLNLAYCALSIGVLFFHAQQLTLLGWLYMLGEVLIVLLLAAVQWRTAHEEKP